MHLQVLAHPWLPAQPFAYFFLYRKHNYQDAPVCQDQTSAHSTNQAHPVFQNRLYQPGTENH